MADQPDKPSNKYSEISGKAVAIKLQPAKSVELRHLDAPPKITRPKRIHPRRLLPFVREGKERPTHSLNARAVIRHADDPMQEIRVLANTELTQPGQNHTAGAVGEPSVSVNGDIVFYTGNWYAAVSTDRGQTFKFIDPNNMAQPSDPQGVTFCCDQVVNYIPSIDTFVWLLQYGPSTGDNIQRIAFAKTADVSTDLSRWKAFDITTAALQIPGFFMDFPDLATSDNFLYMTTNCFGPDQQTVGSAVVRIPFSSIQQGAPTAEKFVSMDLFSFRVAQNCRDTAYFAAHRDTSTLAVFSWPENQAQPTSQDVANARWIGTNGYISRIDKDGRRWLDRADPRITGATLAGDELWFAWGVDADSNHRPKPFVQMARINSKNMTLIEDVNLFDTDSAICYAGLSTNAKGEVGVSYMIGGGPRFPSHVVGILSQDEANRRSLVVANGERSPMADAQGHFEWGDYLTARPVFPDRKLFVAAGYTLKGTQDSDNQDATPRFVIFGRAGDSGGGGPIAPTDGGTTGATGPGGDTGSSGGGADSGDGADGGNGGDGGGIEVGDGPITDVNTLPTVSSAVAAKIKAACGVHKGVQAAMPQQALPMPQMVTSPGTERWKVKTGQDDDRNLVGKNIINGASLGAGIVPATVEELISIPRPPGFENARGFAPPQFDTHRAQPVETTIWRVEVSITVLKLEKDGDFHLVLQGASGKTMVGEIPTPTKPFIGDSPWLKNIQDARQTVQDKLLHNLSPQNFVLPPGETILMPRNVLSGDLPVPPMAAFRMPQSFSVRADAEGTEALPMPTFMTAVPSTPARITGIGFFDRMHDQTGVAPNVFELHTILKVEWL
jgi:hypothetical protein